MNKFLKRSLLLFLVILLAAIVPIIYRRYEIGQLHNKISSLQKSAPVNPASLNTEYIDYKGIVHVHTSLGGHSTGSFDELIAAANANDLDFVFLTEHYSDSFDTSALTLNGVFGKTTFVGGNEVDTATGDRFLLIPGSKEAASFRNLKTDEFLEKIHAENRLAFITHPERFGSWKSPFDGIEVFSLHSTVNKINWFKVLFDAVWSYQAYPELTMARYFCRPDKELAKFDEVAARRKVVLFSGIDAHSNIGFHFFGDDSGNKLINIKVDPYETTFGLAQVHLLLPNDILPTPENLVAAMKEGNMYLSIPVLDDSNGFAFWAESVSKKVQMGQEISLSDNMMIKAASPQNCRFVVFRNGEKINEAIDVNELELAIFEPGAYRIEAYLDQIGPPFDTMPWIISNPIYVK